MDKKHLEALLFVAKEPLTLDHIVKISEEEETVVLRWLFELENEWKDKGVIIKKVAGGFEMLTNPDCHEIVEKIVPKEYETLSRSAFETVAIIAYNQPATRSSIAQLRGISNPDYGINALTERNLIDETENGYVTNVNFLKFFGINDLKELPKIILDPTDNEPPIEGEPEDDSILIDDKESEELSQSNEQNNFIDG